MQANTTMLPNAFFGRSMNRRGTKREGIFSACPWGHEGEYAVYCYECHEELLHNPVLLPEDVHAFSELVKSRGLNEGQKPVHKDKDSWSRETPARSDCIWAQHIAAT